MQQCVPVGNKTGANRIVGYSKLKPFTNMLIHILLDNYVTF